MKPRRGSVTQLPKDNTMNRRAFTLTELLVVIAIIAVLAALVSAGVMRALDSAKQTRIKVEVDNLDAAFKSYKEKHGSFPPADFGTTPQAVQALKAHIARAFPRYNLSNLAGDLAAAGIVTTVYRPDQAVVFWLRGFGPDVSNPFVTPTDQQIIGGTVPYPTVKVTRTPLFDFDQSRIVGGTPTLLGAYIPPGSKTDVTQSAPYLYIDSSSFDSAPGNPRNMATNLEAQPKPFSSTIFTGAGTATAYWNDINGNKKSAQTGDDQEEWVSGESCQIISAGMDGKYGTSAILRTYPSSGGWDQLDDDNVTNFCNKARLGDMKP